MGAVSKILEEDRQTSVSLRAQQSKEERVKRRAMDSTVLRWIFERREASEIEKTNARRIFDAEGIFDAR